jgi:hypothetical protein
MTDKEKLELIQKILEGNYNWMDAYRKTYKVKDGIGLPSGLTGSEVTVSLIQTVMRGERVSL